jgi:hypothetical protein
VLKFYYDESAGRTCRDKTDEAGASSERMGFWFAGGTTLTGFQTLSGFAILWLKAFPLSGGFSFEIESCRVNKKAVIGIIFNFVKILIIKKCTAIYKTI